MPLIIQETEDKRTLQAKISLSQELQPEILQVNGMIQQDKKNGQGKGKNIKRLQNIADKLMGNESGDSETNIHTTKPKQGDPTLTVNAAKKIIHDIEAIPSDQLGKYSSTITKLKKDAEGKVKGVRNANKITKGFKPKLPKTPKPQNSDNLSIKKPINADDGSQIRLVAENKNIIITENQIKKLLEHRNDLNIPFEEFGSEVNGYKLTYEHYLDYLEEVGHYGELPPSNTTLADIDENIESIVKDSNPSNFMEFDARNNLIQWYITRPEGKKYFIDFEEASNKAVYDLDEDDLTDEGKKNLIKDQLGEYGFPYNLTMNNKNLIYIERIIGVEDIMGQKDIYRNFKNEYDHIGESWSWDEGGSEDFGDDNVGGTDKLILKGWVRPEDVDWEMTVSMNACEINYERELRLNYDAPIQVDDIIFIEKGTNRDERVYKKLPLKHPIILNV